MLILGNAAAGYVESVYFVGGSESCRKRPATGELKHIERKVYKEYEGPSIEERKVDVSGDLPCPLRQESRF